MRALLADINSCTSKQTGGKKAHVIEANANRRRTGRIECVIFGRVIIKVCDVQRGGRMKSLCRFRYSNRLGFNMGQGTQCRPVGLCCVTVLRMRPRNLKLEEHRSATDGSKDRRAAFRLEGVEGSRRKQAEIKNKIIGGVKKKKKKKGNFSCQAQVYFPCA